MPRKVTARRKRATPRKPTASRKATARRTPPARRRPARARSSGAERRLLQLASDLGRLANGPRPPREVVAEALQRLSADAASRRTDEGARLALGWAHEQVRLAFGEILERAARAGAVRVDMTPATMAWLVVAACQTLADEAPDAVPDRLATLAGFIRPGVSSG